VFPQSCPDGNCGEGEGGQYPFVFAIGRIEPRFASLGAEKEFAQATGRAVTAGQTDLQAMSTVLSDRANRYLARQMCWVMSIGGLETYLVTPRDPADLDLLIEAARPAGPGDVDVVIGVRGPVVPPDACNGLQVPLAIFDQVYSFEREPFVAAIARPEGVAERQEQQFRATAGELFDRIMQIADNAGATDEHRAINYLAVRSNSVYARAAEANAQNRSITSIEARPSPISGVRRVMDVIVTFTDRQTDVSEKYFARVDVTEEFPFLVSPLAPFFEH
jgi:hypothetical protein